MKFDCLTVDRSVTDAALLRRLQSLVDDDDDALTE